MNLAFIRNSSTSLCVKGGTAPIFSSRIQSPGIALSKILSEYLSELQATNWIWVSCSLSEIKKLNLQKTVLSKQKHSQRSAMCLLCNIQIPQLTNAKLENLVCLCDWSRSTDPWGLTFWCFGVCCFWALRSPCRHWNFQIPGTETVTSLSQYLHHQLQSIQEGTTMKQQVAETQSLQKTCTWFYSNAQETPARPFGNMCLKAVSKIFLTKHFREVKLLFH